MGGSVTTRKVLKVGIMPLVDFKARTIAIAKGELKPAPTDPKIWFQSIESFAKILSDGNRTLLAIIADSEPESLTELALKTGREKSNLSRTLKTLEQYDLIHFEERAGRQRAPRANYAGVSLEVSFT